MFVANDKHRQLNMFSSITSLPQDELNLLKRSWADTFYHELFCRIDEQIFAVLYSDKPSRPNVPVNILVALEILKAAFGWSDEQLIHNFYFNLQVRYALGLRNLGDEHFDLRTLYNFRQRLSEHMQQTGENLIERVFESLSEEQCAAMGLRTGQVRMDSTYVASNIRRYSRLHLLVEVIQRVYRMLSDIDQARYAADFADYVRGSAGQYVYRVRSEEGEAHMRRIGELMERLIVELAGPYSEQPVYQMLVRVFGEHFTVTAGRLRLKTGRELSANSLNSPDDVEATFRRKNQTEHVGYVANLTETCDRDNPLQLIVKVQTEANVTDDTSLLAAALPDLKRRLAVEEVYTDGGYNNELTGRLMAELGVNHLQSALRGHSAAGLSLHVFQVEMAADGLPESMTCPHGQLAQVVSRPGGRFIAAFAARHCATCPARDRCPTELLKSQPWRKLYFRAYDLEIARRRQRLAQDGETIRRIRLIIESTIAAVKRPFRFGKLPVRGKFRVACLLVGSAAMTNLRRIHRYLRAKATENPERPTGGWVAVAQQIPLLSFFRRFKQLFHRPLDYRTYAGAA
jgi:hypothetical protein